MYETTINSRKYRFNLSEAEFVEMNFSDETFEDVVSRIINSKSMDERKDAFTKLVRLSYGRKSADGRLFYKNENQTNEFVSSKDGIAFIELLSKNSSVAAGFVNNIVSM